MRLIIVFCALLLVTGCGTISYRAVGMSPDAPEPTYRDQVAPIYPVTTAVIAINFCEENKKDNWHEFRAMLNFFLLIGLPVDIAVDTVLIPYDVIYYYRLPIRDEKKKKVEVQP